MTVSTTSIVKQGTQGDLHYTVAELDISSLSNDGYESWHPSNIGVNNPVGGQIVGQEEEKYRFNWDPINSDRINAMGVPTSGTSLSAISSGTNVGKVWVKFEGER